MLIREIVRFATIPEFVRSFLGDKALGAIALFEYEVI